MNKIADYDTLDYDYQVYWNKRDYENSAEHTLLNRIFKNLKGGWFIDIGGSFGRLTDTYYSKYKKSVIIDYSLKTLQKNSRYLTDNYPNIELIAANAYNLPFKENTFDGGLMVRVLHHIEKPNDYFKEVYRVLNGQANYIQEFANKIHLKARLKAILTGEWKIFNKQPYQQPDKNNNEGARKNSSVPFLNYHPKWIKQQLKSNGFNMVKKYGCSYLRIGFLKKSISPNLLNLGERLLQQTLSWTNIPPSIFLHTCKTSHVKKNVDMTLASILLCPDCHGDLEISKERATCKECKREYNKQKGIWDFRI
jgi:ubiquinone/menaquinone biosynthesis C-methylase UbiE